MTRQRDRKGTHGRVRELGVVPTCWVSRVDDHQYPGVTRLPGVVECPPQLLNIQTPIPVLIQLVAHLQSDKTHQQHWNFIFISLRRLRSFTTSSPLSVCIPTD